VSLSAVIRRNDRQPLGSVEKVKASLSEAFPSVQFTLVTKSGPPIPRFSGLGIFLSIWSLLGLVRSPPYPHWYGLFQTKFSAEFGFDQKEPIRRIQVTLYGNTGGADAYFSRLSDSTGWQMKFPAL
jgi:hypothetical protein